MYRMVPVLNIALHPCRSQWLYLTRLGDPLSFDTLSRGARAPRESAAAATLPSCLLSRRLTSHAVSTLSSCTTASETLTCENRAVPSRAENASQINTVEHTGHFLGVEIRGLPLTEIQVHVLVHSL